MYYSTEKILLLILGLFLAGAATIAVTGFRNTSSTSVSELWRLYNTEWLIVAGVIIPAYLGGIYFLLAVLVFNFRSHIEIAHIHMKKVTSTWVLISLILSTCILYIFSISENQLPLVIWIQLATVGIYLLILAILFICKLKQYIYSLFLTSLVILSLSGLLFINNMENGLLLIIFLFVISETNDAFALVFGKIIGKRKALSTISPHKTVEGLIFGILFSASAGFLYNYFILGYPLPVIVPVVILVITSAIAGDIVFSAYKRCHKIKDFKAVINGQGGVLDIYDSLLVASLVFYTTLVCMHGFEWLIDNSTIIHLD